jgi:hypothetical protein
MTVRAYLFQAVGEDPELNALGYSLANGYTGQAPDSPPGDLFWVLRWGPEIFGVPAARGRAKVTSREVSLWAYDRQTNFDAINACIKRWQQLLDSLEAVRTGAGPNDGWITATYWEGDGEDGYDDVYTAQFRSSSYTIVAGGD